MQLTEEYLMSNNGLELLNKLFFSAGEGIIIVNEAGSIILANDRAEKLFAYPKNALLGLQIEKLIPTRYQRNHTELRSHFFAKPSSRPMGEGRDLEGLKKNGETFPLEISLSFITHEKKKLVVAFVTDISTRKRHEHALSESRKKLQDHARDLEAKVLERTRELEHLNMGLKSQIRERKIAETALQNSLEELKKAEQEILVSLEREKSVNELKSRFVSTASHEFRTPLTTIQSSADLIAKYTQEDQQDKRDKHIHRIKGAVQNLTNILNDYLSLEKLESGAIQVNPERFNLVDLIQEITQEFESTLKAQQAIKIQFDDDLGTIYSDEHILRNVLINLISNAIKYSSEGDTIEVLTTSNNGKFMITVKDQGIGIPEKEQEQLFTRFFRAHNATNIQGNGLGLNIVKRYVDLIGGRIHFTSKEQVGSEFIVELNTE